jgi:signal transduction histidine kinase
MRSGSVDREPGRGAARLVPQADGYADYASPASGQYRPAGPGQHRSARRQPGQAPTRNIPTGSLRIKGVPSSAAKRGKRPIRATMTWLLVLPLLTMAGLYGYAAYGTIGPAVAQQDSATVNTDVNGPVRDLDAAIHQERSDAFVFQASHGRLLPLSKLQSDEHRTDQDVRAFIAANQLAQGAEPAAVKPVATQLIATLAGLNGPSGLRTRLAEGAIAPLSAFDQYNGIVHATVPYAVGLANPNSSIQEYQESQAQVSGGQGIEAVAEIGALLSGVAAAGGNLDAGTSALFLQLYEDQKQDFSSAALPLYWQVSPDVYTQALDSTQYHVLTAYEDAIAYGKLPGQLSRSQISRLPGVIGDALSPSGPLLAAEVKGSAAITEHDNHQGTVILERLAGVGGAGLVVVILSAFLLLGFGARITRELTGLRGAAQMLARDRLPGVVRRLRAGDDVDVAAEAPPLDLATKTREVTETVDAFSAVQHTAIEAAVEQARLRKGVSNVFRSLARRNQSLVQRQLRMLDEMERGAQDPDTLAQMFRLDHLTARMRRQAEGLIILSGETPGRRWRQPVPVVEMLRAAISEIEDYVRVDLVTDAPGHVTGAAVADVTHLLAELIENAVVYSPPGTRVQVRGGRVANGYVVEVEDRGLGIPRASRDLLNERLAQPPEFDLADSDQLGLLVVSRLAERNEIKVSLCESGFGGTTAIVLLPPSLVVAGAQPGRLAQGAIAHAARPGSTADRPASAALRPHQAASPLAAAASPRAGAPWFERPAGVGAAHDSLARNGAFRNGASGNIPSGYGAFGDGASRDGAARNGTSPDPASHDGNARNGDGLGGSGQAVAGTPFAGGPPLPRRGGGRGAFGNPAPFQDAAPPMSGQAPPHLPAPPPPSSYHAAGDGGGRSDGIAGSGLPRRQKMASLSPQLRSDRPQAAESAAAGRSPEQARALLSSIQRGLRTGRDSDDGPSPAPPAPDVTPDDPAGRGSR